MTAHSAAHGRLRRLHLPRGHQVATPLMAARRRTRPLTNTAPRTNVYVRAYRYSATRTTKRSATRDPTGAVTPLAPSVSTSAPAPAKGGRLCGTQYWRPNTGDRDGVGRPRAEAQAGSGLGDPQEGCGGPLPSAVSGVGRGLSAYLPGGGLPVAGGTGTGDPDGGTRDSHRGSSPSDRSASRSHSGSSPSYRGSSRYSRGSSLSYPRSSLSYRRTRLP